MSEISWVKISSDIFQHRKINQIRKLPDGDSIALLWMQLLCLAGNTNDTGLIYFTENVPYTSEMLSVELKHPVLRIDEAILVFQKYGMIDVQDRVISICNWEKYQNSEKLQIIREYNRIRKQEQRKKQRERSEKVNGKESATNPGSHALELDKEKEKEKEKKKDKTKQIVLTTRAKNAKTSFESEEYRGDVNEFNFELPGITIIN